MPRPSQRCFRLKPRIVRGCPGRIRQCWGFFRYPLGYAPHTKWFEVFIADNGAAILPISFPTKCCANHNRCWLPPGRHSPHLCKRLPTISDVKLHRPCNICVPVISACSEQRKTEAYSVNCMLTTYNKTNCKKKLQWIKQGGGSDSKSMNQC